MPVVGGGEGRYGTGGGKDLTNLTKLEHSIKGMRAQIKEVTYQRQKDRQNGGRYL